jgi:hypothetical protein
MLTTCPAHLNLLRLIILVNGAQQEGDEWSASHSGRSTPEARCVLNAGRKLLGGGNDLNSNLVGVRFRSRPGQRISSFGCYVVFLGTSRKIPE